MNLSADAVFYDGISAKPQLAQVLKLDEQRVLVKYGLQLDLQRVYMYDDMTLIGALGSIQPIVELKDDARLEFKDALPEWFNLSRKDHLDTVWKLERTPSLILFSIAFVAVLVFAMVKWGVPAASHQVSKYLPVQTMKSWGDEAEKYILGITQESQLPKARQTELLQKYKVLVADDKPAKVIFRAGGSIGANALAIPNNTIILTDELVQLAKNDDELMGVMAHEQGHLAQRHSLQQALSSLGFSVILLMITGDSSDLVTTLPVALIGASYSRDFETEADLYALKMMDQHDLQTMHYANFLQRLADDSGEKMTEKRSWQDFLSSHPATFERIEAVKNYQAQP
ncbi:M48 family metallopeptidase [Acinetobacter pragensis]|uniref:Peptidase n=1 Tax=Acinetobacter pragensis TaxID=1806892 RepID=A0A151Y0S5_9GAMM|nr:M48 family metallopeptidase [Acinetobacter pragensis]KYQ71641.1 peptidase [Acinetobacter pragensis]